MNKYNRNTMPAKEGHSSFVFHDMKNVHGTVWMASMKQYPEKPNFSYPIIFSVFFQVTGMFYVGNV